MSYELQIKSNGKKYEQNEKTGWKRNMTVNFFKWVFIYRGESEPKSLCVILNEILTKFFGEFCMKFVNVDPNIANIFHT